MSGESYSERLRREGGMAVSGKFSEAARPGSLPDRLRGMAALVGNPHHVCDSRPMSERQPEAALLREAADIAEAAATAAAAFSAGDYDVMEDALRLIGAES